MIAPRLIRDQRVIRVGIIAALIVAATAGGLAQGKRPRPNAGAAAPRSTAGGVYTAKQATAGQAKYVERCASCHHKDLQGEAGCVPPLTGAPFFEQWTNQPLERYFAAVRDTMPAGNANSMPPGDYAEIVAYILSENGLPAGRTALKGDPAALRAITIQR